MVMELKSRDKAGCDSSIFFCVCVPKNWNYVENFWSYGQADRSIDEQNCYNGGGIYT